MNRLTTEPCLNDNSQNRDTTHDDAVEALANRLLSGEVVYAEILGSVSDYGMSDVIRDMNTRLLGEKLAEIALNAGPYNDKAKKDFRMLSISVNIAARNVASRIFENVQDYLENENA